MTASNFFLKMKISVNRFQIRVSSLGPPFPNRKPPVFPTVKVMGIFATRTAKQYAIDGNNTILLTTPRNDLFNQLAIDSVNWIFAVLKFTLKGQIIVHRLIIKSRNGCSIDVICGKYFKHITTKGLQQHQTTQY